MLQKNNIKRKNTNTNTNNYDTDDDDDDINNLEENHSISMFSYLYQTIYSNTYERMYITIQSNSFRMHSQTQHKIHMQTFCVLSYYTQLRRNQTTD